MDFHFFAMQKRKSLRSINKEKLAYGKIREYNALR